MKPDETISGIPETTFPTRNSSYNIDDNHGNPLVSTDLREIVLTELFQDTRIDTTDVHVTVSATDAIELTGTVPDERMLGFIDEDLRNLGHPDFTSQIKVRTSPGA